MHKVTLLSTISFINQSYAAFRFSSNGPISQGRKSFLRLQCVHVGQVEIWEQHGHQKQDVLCFIFQMVESCFKYLSDRKCKGNNTMIYNT